jgi:hypothetical protein
VLYEIWAEGYWVQEGKADATLLGTAHGADFPEAVQNLIKIKPRLAKDFDPNRMTYWGCRLFPTEAEARRLYG